MKHTNSERNRDQMTIRLKPGEREFLSKTAKQRGITVTDLLKRSAKFIVSKNLKLLEQI